MIELVSSNPEAAAAEKERIRQERHAEIDHLAGELNSWIYEKLRLGHDPIGLKCLFDASMQQVEEHAARYPFRVLSWPEIKDRMERAAARRK